MRRLIYHVTSAHARDDVRIFSKYFCSLSESSIFECCLVVCDGKGNGRFGDSIIYGLKRFSSRYLRFGLSWVQILFFFLGRPRGLLHIHDPELILAVPFLKCIGFRVVFDAHEDVVAQISTKDYLPYIVRNPIAKLFGMTEMVVLKWFAIGVVGATSAIAKKYREAGIRNVESIENFPILSEFDGCAVYRDWSGAHLKICYIGDLSLIRGLREILDALVQLKSVELHFFGEVVGREAIRLIRQHEGWSKVVRYGKVSRAELISRLSEFHIGLVVFLPVTNHLNSQPNKLFEYMAAGLCVVGSDFLSWKSVIQGNDCGILVNPCKSLELAEGLDFLLANKDVVERLGSNGLAASRNYSWDSELEKIIDFYHKLGAP